MNDAPIKIALLGSGAIARAHMKAFLSFPDLCRITAICDLFPEKAEALAQENGLDAGIYSDLDTLLQEAEVDAVSICLPPDTHCHAAVTALRAGKHVLCEKPMAGSLEECDKMLEAAKESGKLLGIVSQNRFKTPMQKMKRMLDNGAAGAVKMATINSLWWRGENYYDLWWRGTWEKEGGGCVTNHAVHHVDLTQWMLGMPKRITAVIANVAHDNSQCEDVGMSIWEYGDKLVQLTASLVSHGEKQEMIFQCEKGRLMIPWEPAVQKAMPNGFPTDAAEELQSLEAAYAALPESPLENHEAQIANFLRAIRGEEDLVVDGEEGRKAVEIIAAMYLSGCTHQPVELPLGKDSPFYTKAGLLAQMPHFHEKTRSVENFATSEITFGRDVGK